MYWLFWEKNILPGTYYALPPGERLLLRAFVEKRQEKAGFAAREASLR